MSKINLKQKEGNYKDYSRNKQRIEKTIEKLATLKVPFFERINNIDKTLATLIKNKKEKT